MISSKKITATEARNNFFNLLKQSFLEKQIYLIEKGEIPMAYLVPVSGVSLGRKLDIKQRSLKELLEEINQLRDSMKETSDSVGLLKGIRVNGR